MPSLLLACSRLLRLEPKWQWPFWHSAAHPRKNSCFHPNGGVVGDCGSANLSDININKGIWRVAGRESGCPKLLGSPWTPPVRGTPPEAFRRLPRKFSHNRTTSNPELPRKFPKLPRKFPDFPGGQPLSYGSLTTLS